MLLQCFIWISHNKSGVLLCGITPNPHSSN